MGYLRTQRRSRLYVIGLSHEHQRMSKASWAFARTTGALFVALLTLPNLFTCLSVYLGHQHKPHWHWCSPIPSSRGEEKVIAFNSKALNKSERKYCVTRKELLAVIVAVNTYHHYLCGRQFLIRTDHGALKWLLKFKNPEGRLARWLELLGTYDFRIEHRSGIQHGNADALSIRPCGDCRHCDRVEQKGDTASAAHSESAEVTPCPAPQGLDKPKDGNSLSSPRLDTNPLPESQQYPSRSSSSRKALVVMGSKNDLRDSQVVDDDLKKIIS